MIRLAVNLATRRVHASASSGVPLSEYTLTRGDFYPVEVSFFLNGASVTPGIGTMILKKDGDFTGEFLARCNSWITTGGIYAGLLSLNTVEATAAVGTAAQIFAALEITWPVEGGEVSSIPLRIVLHNDYLRGNEGVPTDVTPPYPPPEDILPEAPEDGKLYARQNGAWVEADGAAPTFRRITAPDGSIWRETIDNDGFPKWAKEL